MNRWWLSLSMLALALSATGPVHAQHDVVLSVRSVVSTAKQHNPTLKAAMLQHESATWDVFGNEALYDPVLTADASASQVTTPNVFGGAVRINRVRRVDGGVQLSKHLLWGTDLSLRVSSYVQKNELSGSIAALPTSPMSGLNSSFAGFGVGSFGPVYALVAKLTLKQPLWRGRGKDVGEASLRAARLSEDAEGYARDRVGSELLRDVLTAYWELWYADAAIAIQVQSQAVAVKQRDEAQARVQGGSLAPAEVLSFETQVATRDEDVLTARTERQRRAHELARLLGVDEREAAYGAVIDEPLSDLDTTRFAREEVERQALSQSAEVHERGASVELARVQQQTADDPKKPRLDLDTYIQTQGLGNKSFVDATGQFVGGDVVSGFVGLTFEAPVRDHQLRAASARARLATQVAEEQLREVRQRVLSEVRSALDREATGREKVALAERTVGIAERQLIAEQARYQSGASTPLAVLEAEDKVRSAKLRLARARADLVESGLVIEHLTGELLERYASL
jgi:outer membrane protein